ncbi:reverse transcriptase, partial [Staphylococcus simiae]
MDNIRYITEMSNIEAKNFLLKSDSYCTIDLPKYFQFDKVLKKIDEYLEEIDNNNKLVKSNISINHLKQSDSVNCKIFANKDGQFDWRPLEILNPYIYVYLVRYITKEDNWKNIIDVINNNSSENIIITSIPIESLETKKDKEEQILNWWDKVEQQSIELALKYNYILMLDISNCYGSIYTHAIAWAIHGKEIAKNSQNDKSLIGNNIDKYIRLMQNNQTNGIPQGSILMDFIAEIILSYADKNLQDKLKKVLFNPYKIIRYRDDYRIFSNSK